MRFLTISAALALPANVFGAVTCPVADQNANWYINLVWAGFTAVADPVRAAVATSMTGTHATKPAAWDANLVADLAAPTSACGTCAFTFIEAVYALKTGLGTTCSATTWATAASATSSITGACQILLYDAINAFNTCAGNGLNLVTGAAPTRCAKAEFTDFAIAFNPLSAIAECTYSDTAITSATAIANCVGSDFIAAKASLGCKTCFDALMTDIRGISATCVNSGEYSYSDCSGISTLQTAFAACSGGMTFADVEEVHCSANQIRVIEAMRPYTSVVKCAFLASGDGYCLDYYNTVRDALDELNDDGVCSAYFSDFVTNAINDAPAICETTPFAAACTDVLGAYEMALYAAQVSAGMVIDATTTKCSSTQWRAIVDSEKSYVPFVRCAMKGTSPASVLDCIESDSFLDNVLATAPCASCFKQLAIEAYVARTKDLSLIVEAVCADPYSSACVTALAKPLAIFKDCSGFNAVIISNAQCSASARAALESENAGLSKVKALVGSSATATQALYQYSQISSTLSAIDFPCMFCHLDLIASMFDLSVADKAVCVANIISWDCYMAMGINLDNFYRCSRGWGSTAVTSAARDAWAP